MQTTVNGILEQAREFAGGKNEQVNQRAWTDERLYPWYSEFRFSQMKRYLPLAPMQSSLLTVTATTRTTTVGKGFLQVKELYTATSGSVKSDVLTPVSHEYLTSIGLDIFSDTGTPSHWYPSGGSSSGLTLGLYPIPDATCYFIAQGEGVPDEAAVAYTSAGALTTTVNIDFPPDFSLSAVLWVAYMIRSTGQEFSHDERTDLWTMFSKRLKEDARAYEALGGYGSVVQPTGLDLPNWG